MDGDAQPGGIIIPAWGNHMNRRNISIELAAHKMWVARDEDHQMRSPKAPPALILLLTSSLYLRLECTRTLSVYLSSYLHWLAIKTVMFTSVRLDMDLALAARCLSNDTKVSTVCPHNYRRLPPSLVNDTDTEIHRLPRPVGPYTVSSFKT